MSQQTLLDALPSWLPELEWAGYIEMRNQAPKAKRPTELALRLVQKRLLDFHLQGQNVGAILEQSIRNGWADVYAIRPERGQRADGFTATINNFQAVLEARR